jgi:hypothetical protein
MQFDVRCVKFEVQNPKSEIRNPKKLSKEPLFYFEESQKSDFFGFRNSFFELTFVRHYASTP